MSEVLASGVLDSLSGERTAFHEISMSRMGYFGDRGLAEMLFDELRSCGLARTSEDDVSVPLHPQVRYLILVCWRRSCDRLVRRWVRAGACDGSNLIVRGLADLLDAPEAPSSGHVVQFDLQAVSVDLRSVPLDEVLPFRLEHRVDYQRYARAVRDFARQLSLMPESERAAMFDDRRAQIDA